MSNSVQQTPIDEPQYADILPIVRYEVAGSKWTWRWYINGFVAESNETIRVGSFQGRDAEHRATVSATALNADLQRTQSMASAVAGAVAKGKSYCKALEDVVLDVRASVAEDETPANNMLLIEWIDAFGCPTGWEFEDEVDPSVTSVQSVGFFLKETDEFVFIAPHVSTTKDRRQLAGHMAIPKKQIISRVTLGEIIRNQNRDG